ncbi:AlpA family phage regulatory protein [Mesorhizobium sp. AR07]|uniref:helix-turn-helix transcriptional regulator n=1 Tax=Mesorhizobium sp. AR07 TaxID=2865838 RepID=UPI00215F4BF5|nr:AlpA family phage regulatory protein [Mesorhizobium sp. AR07]UVK46831.1 AlpA family phage regulatory protein [Mesorhizobium sp. AR07]
MALEGLLKLDQVKALTGLSRTEIYRRIAAGAFPKQRRVSHKVARWSEAEVGTWIDGVLHG